MHSKATTVALHTLLIVLVAAGTANAADPSLVGWWNADEGPGSPAADASGNGNHGALNGGVQWVAQETGGALEFDGTSGYVRIPFGNTLKLLNQGDFTVSAWFRADAIPTENKEVFQQADGNGSGRTWLFIANGTGEIRTYLGNAATPSTVNVTPETWFHAAVVVKEAGATDTIQIYVNGRPAGAAGQRGMENSEGAYLIGCHKNLTNFWDGLIDDVRLYKRALTPEEIAKMIPPKLKAYKPDPADSTVGVTAPLLKWTAGETAILHNVYLGTSPDLTEANLVANRQPMALYFHVAGLEAGATYWWRVDEIEADMTTVHTGDVWSFVTQALTAYHPNPANGSGGVSPALTLTWFAGTGATKHHLYFSDSLDAVKQGAADADKGELTVTTFTPADLQGATSYYWRVDQVLADGTIRSGEVWSFTTCILVDDFESYTDDEGNRIYETWTDGWTNSTGAVVGNLTAPFAEQRIVHAGKQSMPMDYNNINSPFYSEAECEFAPVQNWTTGDMNDLSLWLRGNPSNSPDKLYVAVEDSAGKVAVAPHPDPGAVTTGAWTEWKTPLSSLTGVNLSRVKKLYIGVGDRKTPVAGGAGRIYIDDIRLTKP